MLNDTIIFHAGALLGLCQVLTNALPLSLAVRVFAWLQVLSFEYFLDLVLLWAIQFIGCHGAETSGFPARTGAEKNLVSNSSQKVDFITNGMLRGIYQCCYSLWFRLRSKGFMESHMYETAVQITGLLSSPLPNRDGQIYLRSSSLLSTTISANIDWFYG